MKNLDILANAIRAESESAPPEPSKSFSLSDEDVDKIANRMIEIMSNKTDSVVESGSANTEIKTENADTSAGEETENNGSNDGEPRAMD